MSDSTVLVTGGAGYLGSILTRQLLDDGHDVVVLDRFLFGDNALAELRDDDSLTIIEGDVRDEDVLEDAVSRADDIVHMAAIVGDPACSDAVDEAIETNLDATVRTKQLAAEHDVSQFVFVSTCSVYGNSETGSMLDETSPVNPVSVYAQTKQLAETSLLEEPMGLDVTALRLATVYGLSPRPRFDLVVNLLTKMAVEQGTGTIFGGDQWRPFIHTRDVARGIRAVLDAPAEDVGGEVFNVGRDDENYTMAEVGKLIDDAVPEADVTVDETVSDDRTYRVTFEKLREATGFVPEIRLPQGIDEIRDALETEAIEDPDSPLHLNHASGGKEVE
ncbi:NAD-dependent epimerase/dehydratase family protein [Haloarchaeobius litoreus]|uniref:NAD-dependent epimerase/dehydratase family protein n=1 Tax=Haloarchaeobius litoreus TaxID=755306 RepID=A0ABD6DIC5_9EURY|nr:SDR family oxidoreductase [Haloarchaeobius litoreus]